MSVLSLKTIANQAFGVPFDGGPTVEKSSYGAPDPVLAVTEPVSAPNLKL